MGQPLNRRVEVVYASAHRQEVVHIDFKATMRVKDAIHQSGLLEAFPEIDLANNAVGIFGRRVSLDKPLKAGDRVEIYRPLKRSPRDALRQHATKRNRL